MTPTERTAPLSSTGSGRETVTSTKIPYTHAPDKPTKSSKDNKSRGISTPSVKQEFGSRSWAAVATSWPRQGTQGSSEVLTSKKQDSDMSCATDVFMYPKNPNAKGERQRQRRQRMRQERRALYQSRSQTTAATELKAQGHVSEDSSSSVDEDDSGGAKLDYCSDA